MRFIWNILAVIGLAVLGGGGYLYATIAPELSEFDPEAFTVYKNFATELLETKDPAVIMIHKVQVEEGLEPADVKESLKSLATSKNLFYVGEAPFYKQVEAITGEPYRHVTFMSFCDAAVGKMMADYRDSYTGFMPCRIAIVEDTNGRLWLHAMNLEMMIYGGKKLPPELKSEAIRVWDTMREMMDAAAAGEF